MSEISEIAQFLRSQHRYFFGPDPWENPEIRDEVHRRWPGASEADIDMARKTAREIFEADCAYQLESHKQSTW